MSAVSVHLRWIWMVLGMGQYSTFARSSATFVFESSVDDDV